MGIARHSMAQRGTARTNRIQRAAKWCSKGWGGQGTFQNVPGSRASDSTVAVMPRHGPLLVPPPPWLVCTRVITQVYEVQPTCIIEVHEKAT